MNQNESLTPTQVMDSETTHSLQRLAVDSQILANRIPGVQTVLFVLSTRGVVFDTHSLRHKTQMAYPGAQVYFVTPLGIPVGESAPRRVDLVVDFTAPGTRHSLFAARRWRRVGRFVIGRNSGFFRVGRYDKVFDERSQRAAVPSEQLERERFVQKTLLEMVGIALVQTGDASPDRGKVTPLSLPPLQALRP